MSSLIALGLILLMFIYLYVHHTHVGGGRELKLQVIVSYLVGTGNQSWIPYKSD